MYHAVGGRSHSRRFARFVLEPGLFSEHLDAIQASGMTTISAKQLGRVARGSPPAELPPRAVALTFDDALGDFETLALPELVARQMVATVFVPTAFIGRNATWLDDVGEGRRVVLGKDSLRAIHHAGIECASHSRTHPELDRVTSASRLDEETRVSREELEDVIGAQVFSYAYPFGYHSMRVRQAVASAGFLAGFGVDELVAKPLLDDPTALPRMTIPAGLSSEQLLELVLRPRSFASDARATTKRGAWRVWRQVAPRRTLRRFRGDGLAHTKPGR